MNPLAAVARQLPALAAGAVALCSGALALAVLTARGSFPGAAGWHDVWPLTFAAVLVAVLGVGVARRAPPAALALACLCWAAALGATADLPSYPSAAWFGDGPAAAGVYAALALAGGLYAVAAPRAHGPLERAAALFAFLSSSNGRLFAREGETLYGLLAAAALLCLDAAWERVGSLLRGRVRWVVLCAVCLDLWVLAAALAGDALDEGLAAWARLTTGMIAGACCAAALERRAAPSVLLGLLCGTLAALALHAVGLAEASRFVSLERLLASRARLFDQHPNHAGPLFAASALVALALAWRPPTPFLARRGVRVGLALLAAACAAELAWTRSRASFAGAGAGALVLALALRGWLPRRRTALAALGAAALLAVVGAAVIALTPLGAPLRAKLDGLAQGPSALGQRWHFCRSALATLAEHPALGAGPKQYYVHAQHAAPSFYDGTAQDLHPHNLPLALAEGAGWPALAAALALAALCGEALRRAAFELGRAPPGGVVAAAGAAVVALLAANLLDLGQSQSTLVPLALWLALGAAAAAARREGDPAAAPPSTPGKRAARALLLALAICAAAAPPVVAGHATELALAELEAGRPRRALERLEWAVRASPWDARAHLIAAGAWRELGRGAQARAEYLAAAAAAPSRSRAGVNLAQDEQRQGRAAEARAHLAEAARLDPRGPDRANFAAARAWLALLGSERDAALAELAEALLGGSPLLDGLPRAAGAGGDRTAPRAFPLADGGAIEVREVLDAAFERVLELERSDPTQARRGMVTLLSSARDHGQAALGIHWWERLAAVQPTLVSLESMALATMVEAGLAERAWKRIEELGRTQDVFFAAPYLAASLQSADRSLAERAAPHLAAVERGLQRFDVFFDLGVAIVAADVLLDHALVTGDASARSRLEGALYHLGAPQARIKRAQAALELAARAGASDATLTAAVDLLLASARLDPVAAASTQAMKTRAELVIGAWHGPRSELALVLDASLGDHGLARATFMDALRKRLAGRE